jgi:hypothetical protein
MYTSLLHICNIHIFSGQVESWCVCEGAYLCVCVYLWIHIHGSPRNIHMGPLAKWKVRTNSCYLRIFFVIVLLDALSVTPTDVCYVHAAASTPASPLCMICVLLVFARSIFPLFPHPPEHLSGSERGGAACTRPFFWWTRSCFVFTYTDVDAHVVVCTGFMSLPTRCDENPRDSLFGQKSSRVDRDR